VPLVPFVFFFQAEDGIRDFHVTGVQTCALPISDCMTISIGFRAPSQAMLARGLLEAAADQAMARAGLAGGGPYGEPALPGPRLRSEERRVGKEGRRARAPRR